MLINKDSKRRNSDPTGGNAHLDIAAPRQTGKTATELCSFSIIWWSFLGLLRFLKVDGTWGPEGGVSRRMVKKIKLDDMIHDVKTKFFFFFEANLPYIIWITAFNTSFLLFYLVLDMWIFSEGDSGKVTKKHEKADTPPPVIQIGNPPPLLELINRHSLAIFLLVCPSRLHRSHMSLITCMIYFTLGQCSNRPNQSNNFDHVYFGCLGNDHPSFILGNPLWCTTFCDYFLEDKAINELWGDLYIYIYLIYRNFSNLNWMRSVTSQAR